MSTVSTPKIGIAGAVSTIVGFVIGVSVFILPGTLAASTGPAIVVTYFFASLMAVFACFVGAQLGAAFPVSAGSYHAVTTLLGPFWGFLLVWLIVGAGAIAVALLAYGFADYLSVVFKGWDRRILALGVVVLLGLVNLLGIKKSVAGQVIMVFAFMLALTVFTVAGSFAITPAYLSPFAPNGYGPVALAVIPAYFSYAGFMVILELGGEIRDPTRSIPIALAFSFLVVVLTYCAVSMVLVGVIPWQELAQTPAPVSAAAEKVLPESVASLITWTAVAAAATSVNGLMLGYSRDVQALVERRLLPRQMLPRAHWIDHGSSGVVPIMLVSLLAILLGDSIQSLATLAVFGILVFQLIVGYAALQLPRRQRSLYQNLSFQMPVPVLRLASWGLMSVSSLALFAVAWDAPGTLVSGLTFSLLGIAYYLKRRSANDSTEEGA